MSALVQALRSPEPRFAVEFSPARSAEAAERQWRAVQEVCAWNPVLAAVTYGAAGSSRSGTVELAGRIAAGTPTLPLAHLTAVGESVDGLRAVLGELRAAGVHDVLALRGDPAGGPSAPWRAHPDGLQHAAQLVRLAREEGMSGVGVAAFPLGHPASADLETDTRHLVAKIRAGADFAVAQLCFEEEDVLRLRDRLQRAGVDVPLLPGILPVTTPGLLDVVQRLTGGHGPPWLRQRLDPLAGDPAAFHEAGIEIAVRSGQRLLAEGVHVLHLHSLNRSAVVGELVQRLGLRPAPVR